MDCKRFLQEDCALHNGMEIVTEKERHHLPPLRRMHGTQSEESQVSVKASWEKRSVQ